MRKKLLLHFLFLPVFLLVTLYSTATAQSCTDFYDGFESGALGTAWTIGTGTYTRTVTTVNPAVGQYNFNQTSAGANSFYQGTFATFTAAQPTYFSFWMRTNTTTAANGYVVIGNSNIATDNGILFCYFNATSGLRFFNTTGYNHPITANTWYHVEARNVNWTSRTMDIYVDNVLILPGWAFRSPSATNVDRIHLFSLSAAAAQYDEIQIGLPGVAVDSSNVTAPLCMGDSTGAIDISASSPNGAISYLWSTGDSTQDIMNLPAGSYTVSVTDSIGCTVVESFTVTDPGAIAPIAVPTDLLCPGDGNGALDVTVSGGTPGYTYIWSTGDTTQDISGLAGGTYSLTVTDLNGCEGNNTFAVAEPSPFSSSATTTTPTCEGGNDGTIDYQLSGANGDFSYLWSTSDTTQDISGLSAGLYTVFVQDSLGCAFTDSVLVSDPAGINPNAVITSPLCFSFGNGHIDLSPSGGMPTYTYVWNTGATSQNLPAAGAGTYTVTITDANGCISVDSFLVTEPAALSTSAGTTPSTGSSNGAIDLTVNGGTPPYTYLWSNGPTTQDISGLNTGTYTVTVTDANGCTVTDTIFVDEVIAVMGGNGLMITASPNPFAHSFTVSVHGIGAESVRLTLADLAGRVVWQAEASEDGEMDVNIDLPVGMYLLRMEQGDVIRTIKLMRN